MESLEEEGIDMVGRSHMTSHALSAGARPDPNSRPNHSLRGFWLLSTEMPSLPLLTHSTSISIRLVCAAINNLCGWHGQHIPPPQLLLLSKLPPAPNGACTKLRPSPPRCIANQPLRHVLADPELVISRHGSPRYRFKVSKTWGRHGGEEE